MSNLNFSFERQAAPCDGTFGNADEGHSDLFTYG